MFIQKGRVEVIRLVCITLRIPTHKYACLILLDSIYSTKKALGEKENKISFHTDFSLTSYKYLQHPENK